MACAAAAVTQGSALAQPVVLPIVNPGFEQLNVTLRPGEQSNGAGGVAGGSGLMETPVNTRWTTPFQPGGNMAQSGVIVPGWRTAPGGTGSLAGVLNPDVRFPTPSDPARAWMTGYSGNHVATAQAAVMQQTLNVQLAPSTLYTVSFLAGIGITDSNYFPIVQLFASPDLSTFARFGVPGVSQLAQMPFVNIDRPQFGAMRPYSFTYTTPSVLPPELVSKFITVSITGSDGIPRVNFDDFNVTAVPGPATGGAILMMLLRGVSRRRRGT